MAALVPRGARVADVGTGPGDLPLGLGSSGHASHCVATERSPRLLGEVRRRLGDAEKPRWIELRAGDGLAPLSPADNLDVLILAGMGARKIIHILERGRPAALGIRRVVLQPQSEHARLFAWLGENGFRATGLVWACDRRRLYRVIAADVPANPAPLI